MIETTKRKYEKFKGPCRIKVSLSNLVEVINNYKGSFDTGELKIHKNELYQDLANKVKKSFLFPEEINVDEKLNIISKNISENLLIGYEENLKNRFYMVANINDVEFMQSLSKNASNIIKIRNIIKIERFDLYMVEYEILKNLELEVFSVELEDLLATYL